MAEITYFHRNKMAGYSIMTVFNTLTNEISKTKTVQQFYVPSHRANIFSIIKNILFVFRHRNKCGVNHISGDIHYCVLALIGCKVVLTIHDLSALDCQKNTIKKVLIKFLWFNLPLLFADKIVCISKHTRDQLAKITKRQDIEVIYNAINPRFAYCKKKFNEIEPVILIIGTAWNKNIVNTITALNSMRCHLRIIGQISNSEIELLQFMNMSYSSVVNLTEEEMIDEFVNADIISFCSIYEGFGMPIIEANAVGRCVVTSNLAPMTEIGGSAAYFVDPNKIESIREGLKNVLMDEKLRDELVFNGTSNIKRFYAKVISRDYINIYSSLL